MNGIRIFQVYTVHPHPDGIQRHLTGRFAIMGDDLIVLEDYEGILAHLPEGPITPATQKAMQQMANSSYLDVVPLDHIEGGLRDDLIQPETFGEEDGNGGTSLPVAQPPPTFRYMRAGMAEPQIVEFTADGRTLMNGMPLTPEELRVMLENVKTGIATLRYSNTMNKSESTLSDLMKADGEGEEKLHGVLQKLHELHAQGLIPKEHIDTLHQHLYGDTLVPEMGNRKAYKDFLSRPRGGTHFSADLNDFKSINDALGHHVGDQALVHAGRAFREAMDEAVGRDKGKVFRVSGDEFVGHVQTPEQAHAFARALRSKLESIPPMGGTHKIGASLGLGATPEMADQALTVHAKSAKQDAVQAITGVRGSRQKMRAPHTLYVHSLIPGQEGPIVNGPEKPPAIPAPVTPENPPLQIQKPTPAGAVAPQASVAKSEE